MSSSVRFLLQRLARRSAFQPSVLLLFLSLGCSSTAQEGDVTPDQLPVSDFTTPAPDLVSSDALPVLDVASSAPVEDISGRWLQLQTSMLILEFSGSQPLDGTIFTYHLVIHEQTGGGWEAQHEICSIKMKTPGLPSETVIPPAYVACLPKYTRSVEYVSDGAGGFSYNGSDYIETKGCVLDSLDDELPTEPDDPRVVDQDEDGRPGITLRLVGTIDGDLYIAQRDRTRPHGAALSADRIEGLLDWDSSQSILESDPPLLKQLSPTAATHPDPTLSRFDMLRIPDDADCAWVNENKDSLFPHVPR